MKKKLMVAAIIASMTLAGCSAAQKEALSKSIEEDVFSESVSDINNTQEENEIKTKEENTENNTESSSSIEEKNNTEQTSDKTEESSENKNDDNTTDKDTINTTTTATSLVTPVSALDFDDMFSKTDLNDEFDKSSSSTIVFDNESADVNGSGVTADGTTVTISDEGTYIVSGKSEDGQIVVNVDDSKKVHIILNGVKLTNKENACIYIKSADKTVLTLVNGTENILSDSSAEYKQENDDENVDAVIYSKDDLAINGTGELTVNANYKRGIASNDDLIITDGKYNITANGKGIVGKDSIRIQNGTFTVNAKDDAFHTSNGEEAGKGYVYIENGDFTVTTDDDGIHAETALVVKNGTINIEKSKEGLEGATVDIFDGEINITASDDGINAAISDNTTSNVEEQMKQQKGKIKDSSTQIEQSENNSNEQPEVPDKENMPAPPDGDGRAPDMIETQNMDQNEIQVSSGEPQQEAKTAQDGTQKHHGGKGGPRENGQINKQNGTEDNFKDQMNGQMPQNGFHGGGGGGGFDAQPDTYIKITGGNININANGDGIDSNGEILITGGNVVVDGPENNGNGAIDFGVSAKISGGTIISSGSAGMVEKITGDGQKCVSYIFDQQIPAGTKLTLSDENGKVIMETTPTKAYQMAQFSSSEIKDGEYTITAGDYSVKTNAETSENTAKNA